MTGVRVSGAAGEAQDDPAGALRARGERLTPQRLLVLEALRDAGGHHTAEALYARARERYPYVRLATIYRTLRWLTGVGLVSETDLGGGQSEYEYLRGARHHHLVCLRCGGETAFDDALVAPLAAALRERYGFAARIDHLAVFGRCQRCLAAEPAPTARAGE